jgi:transcriptional regulator with XRE-family HTH domain
MDVGSLIRDLRREHGWSQGRLADELNRVTGYKTNVTREEVSRWERGKVVPAAWWLARLAIALQVPLALLENPDVYRRKFLTTVAATAIAPVIGGDLLTHGFASALRGRPSGDAWRDTLETYGRDYMSAGAAEIQQRLAGDLVVLQQQLDTPDMWQVAARLATLYAKTYPGSDGTKAVDWYRLAAEAADRSGDVSTRVWVRGRAAIALGYEGAALPMAERFADEAMSLSEKPSLGRLNAIMGKAHAAANKGDRGTALALLEDGQRVFDVAASGDREESDYAVPEWRMGVFTSLLAARLGDEHRATVAQDRAALLLPATLPRFRTHLEMHRGLMMARAGDKSGGTAYAQAALDRFPPEKHSLTLRMLMDEIRA